MELKKARNKIKEFMKERDWEQFNTPKNLMLSLNVEAGELLSLVEWMNDEQVKEALKNPDFRKAVSNEVADVFHHLLNLCNQLEIDPIEVFNEKFDNSMQRFPIGKSKRFNPVDWKIKKLKEKKEVRL